MSTHLTILEETREELVLMGIETEIRKRRVMCIECRFKTDKWNCAVHNWRPIRKSPTEGLNMDGLCERWESKDPSPVPVVVGAPRMWTSPLIWTPVGAVLGFLLGLITREIRVALPRKMKLVNTDLFDGLNQSAIRPLRQGLQGICSSKLRRDDDGFTLSFTGPTDVVEVVMFAMRRLAAVSDRYVAFVQEINMMMDQFRADLDNLERGAPAESN